MKHTRRSSNKTPQTPATVFLGFQISRAIYEEFKTFRKLRNERREFPWQVRDCIEEALGEWLDKQAKKMRMDRPAWTDEWAPCPGWDDEDGEEEA